MLIDVSIYIYITSTNYPCYKRPLCRPLRLTHTAIHLSLLSYVSMYSPTVPCPLTTEGHDLHPRLFISILHKIPKYTHFHI